MKKILIIAVLSFLLTSCFGKTDEIINIETEIPAVENTIIENKVPIENEETVSGEVVEANSGAIEKVSNGESAGEKDVEVIGETKKEGETKKNEVKNLNTNTEPKKNIKTTEITTSKTSLTKGEENDIDEVMNLLEDIFDEANNEK